MKKALTLLLASAMALSMAACGSGGTSSSESAGSAPTGSEPAASGAASQAPGGAGGEIYYLNFKPEIAPVYEKIAADYKAETGITLKVVTASSGTYEQQLKSEMAKNDAPTLFQINGPRGYATWKDYCKDLKDSEIYKHLSDPGLAITSGDGVYGIPYVVEGYGIIYNKAIMDKYFALPDKAVSIASTEEIKNFDTMKQVVEDMTAKKEALGIEGVFASTSLIPGEDWRWQTHLANVPIYYEFKANNVDLASDATREVAFQNSDNYKNLFDLYLNNSVTEKGLLGSKSVDDSMAEFALGRCAMVQNGNWAWSQISGVQGNTVSETDIKFMPMYTGIAGEESQGICVGTENFLSVNSQSSPEQQKLAEDFLYWLYSSDKGKAYVTNELGFIAPFDTFGDAEKPKDPLALEVVNWMNKDGITSVPWNFTVFPNQTFKDNFGAALLEYAQGNQTWEEVKTLFVEQWKSESAM